MSAPIQIRRERVGSSGATANGPAEVWVERPSPGGAPATQRVFPIAGGEIRIEQAGSRVNVTILMGRGLRNRLTASLSPADAECLCRGGIEAASLARSYRQAKGA